MFLHQDIQNGITLDGGGQVIPTTARDIRCRERVQEVRGILFAGAVAAHSGKDVEGQQQRPAGALPLHADLARLTEFLVQPY